MVIPVSQKTFVRHFLVLISNFYIDKFKDSVTDDNFK